MSKIEGLERLEAWLTGSYSVDAFLYEPARLMSIM